MAASFEALSPLRRAFEFLALLNMHRNTTANFLMDDEFEKRLASMTTTKLSLSKVDEGIRSTAKAIEIDSKIISGEFENRNDGYARNAGSFDPAPPTHERNLNTGSVRSKARALEITELPKDSEILSRKGTGMFDWMKSKKSSANGQQVEFDEPVEWQQSRQESHMQEENRRNVNSYEEQSIKLSEPKSNYPVEVTDVSSAVPTVLTGPAEVLSEDDDDIMYMTDELFINTEINGQTAVRGNAVDIIIDDCVSIVKERTTIVKFAPIPEKIRIANDLVIQKCPVRASSIPESNSSSPTISNRASSLAFIEKHTSDSSIVSDIEICKDLPSTPLKLIDTKVKNVDNEEAIEILSNKVRQPEFTSALTIEELKAQVQALRIRNDIAENAMVQMRLKSETEIVELKETLENMNGKFDKLSTSAYKKIKELLNDRRILDIETKSLRAQV